ncbi:MAG: hypothetical protein PHW96_01480 [Candidatus Nanoarchaeia archaeon]|nr:hypothetical protein [Candidatus Nanoarchaeia archaeon]
MIFGKSKEKEKLTDGMIKTFSRDIDDILSQLSVLKRDMKSVQKRISDLENKKV